MDPVVTKYSVHSRVEILKRRSGSKVQYSPDGANYSNNILKISPFEDITYTNNMLQISPAAEEVYSAKITSIGNHDERWDFGVNDEHSTQNDDDQPVFRTMVGTTDNAKTHCDVGVITEKSVIATGITLSFEDELAKASKWVDGQLKQLNIDQIVEANGINTVQELPVLSDTSKEDSQEFISDDVLDRIILQTSDQAIPSAKSKHKKPRKKNKKTISAVLLTVRNNEEISNVSGEETSYGIEINSNHTKPKAMESDKILINDSSFRVTYNLQSDLVLLPESEITQLELKEEKMLDQIPIIEKKPFILSLTDDHESLSHIISLSNESNNQVMSKESSAAIKIPIENVADIKIPLMKENNPVDQIYEIACDSSMQNKYANVLDLLTLKLGLVIIKCFTVRYIIN